MAKVLVIAAHPDDETVFAGGFLAKLAGEGNEIYLLETTRGEGGEVGDPPVGPKERLGEFREQELRAAAAALGVKEVRFLGYVDPAIDIGEQPLHIDVPLDEFAGTIARQMEEIRPDVILTHGTNGEYGHPQHVYTLQAVRQALRQLAPWFPGEFITWCANAGVNSEDRLTNKDDAADLVLDIAPWFDRKVAAMMCHRSQHTMFLRNSQAPSVRDMTRTIEAFRHWTPEEVLADEAPPAPQSSDDWRMPE